MRSRRAPTTRHPYGYLKDKFVWSLVSAVGIFCLGAGITTAHGVSSLLAGPQALENLGYGMTGDRRLPNANENHCCYLTVAMHGAHSLENAVSFKVCVA